MICFSYHAPDETHKVETLRFIVHYFASLFAGIYFNNSNSKLKLYKIQNITVIENPKPENEEDFAEDIAKAIEEAHLFSSYFGI